MAEYIERDAVIRDLEAAEKHGGMGMIVAQTLKSYVKRVPAADVVPVVHAKWSSVFLGDDWKIKCSNCGRWFDRFADGTRAPEYCFCGAKMDLKDLEESK